jgi:hypothetical protein
VHWCCNIISNFVNSKDILVNKVIHHIYYMYITVVSMWIWEAV